MKENGVCSCFPFVFRKIRVHSQKVPWVRVLSYLKSMRSERVKGYAIIPLHN